jgi:hypothetical protein
MATEWIEQLADEIKEKNKEAASEYGRAQHYAGIVAVQGKEFFVALVLRLQENVDALRSRLQGDATASETRVQTSRADEVKITRSRFPWIDARLTHRDDTLTLDYAKGLGMEGSPKIEREAGRTTRTFTFRVAQDDSLVVEEAFVGASRQEPRQYKQPEELARHITELLFGAGG